MSLGERLTGVGYQLGWKAICRIPEPWARALFNGAAGLAWRRQGKGVLRLEANLRRVLRDADGTDPDGADIRAMSYLVLRSYCRYWLEAFRMQVIPVERLVDGMHINPEGQEAMLACLKAGRGVVLTLPHMGNFEQAGAWAIAVGAGRLTSVAERLKPESLYEAFVKFREGVGMEILPATGSGHPFGILAQRLRKGGLVCLVSDRDLTDTGAEVDFFGEKARMASGAAVLAERTGAALMPVATWFEGDTEWGARIYPEVPVPEEGTRQEKVQQMTQQVANMFELAIREHPQDWHMLQRLFTADLEPRRVADRPRGPVTRK
jgi:phosphatidylinositol dimannoside acyltransferase